MAEYTPNLALKKPSNSDYVRISDNNENMDVLDAEIKALQDAIEELESVEVINDLNHTDTDKALSANQGKVLDDKISTLTGRIAIGEKTAAYEAKRLDNLVKLTQGKVFDYQTDVTEAYTKTIPSGSQEYGALNMVGGKSLVYNQLISRIVSSRETSGITITNGGRYFTANGTGTASVNVNICTGIPVTKDHIYILRSGRREAVSDTGESFIQLGVSTTYITLSNRAPYSIRATAQETTTSGLLRFRIKEGLTYDNVKCVPQLFDLTAMFGAGNEPTLEAFEELFPMSDNLAYNAGELMNFGVNEVESVGANQSAMVVGGINSTTGAFNTDIKSRRSDYFDATNGVSYQLFENGNVTTKTLQSFICFYDANKNFICRGGGSQRAKEIYTASQVPTGAVYAAITFYEHANNQLDIYQMNKSVQVMIKASGEAITEYIPYRKETFTIPQSILDLPMYGASAGSAYNYIDFDRKVYVQNVESVDLGTLKWSKKSYNVTTSGRTIDYFEAKITGSKIDDCICTKYQYYGAGVAIVPAGTSGIAKSASTVGTMYIVDGAFTDAAAFKTAMSGIMLNCQLATPIETDISDLIDNGLIFAEGNGTITFKNIHGDDYHISVPNKETYMVKLADAI